MTKVCILDDEVLICETLNKYLEELGYEVPAYALDYDEAIEIIEENQPDIMLLDINIGGGKSGIDVARYIRDHHNIPLIFISSYSDKETVQEAGKVHPNGYLVKPFNKNDLLVAIEIAISNFSLPNNNSDHQEIQETEEEVKLLTDALFIKNGSAYKKIFFKDIQYIKADGVYATIYTQGQKLLIRESMRGLMKILPVDSFYQTHRSYIVNLHSISLIDKGYVVIGNESIPISRNQQEEFFKRLNFLQ